MGAKWLQLSPGWRVQSGVDAKLISAGGSGPLGLPTQTGDILIALFALSPTLWVLAFVVYFVWLGFSSGAAAVFQALQFRLTPRVVTLFPNGSTTSRPTLPG
jgi:hypothetical protein